ncbi:C-5 cytosine-specific DNA methylase domain protein [Leptospira interrogans str. UI 13372]|nr:C-5 cytosine-specific DNA methylase domain protein [Leptospira interrogans str. UI 13372]
MALFAGAGGSILGGKLLGWRTVCAVEIDPYCITQLIQRQNDKILPPFPIWDDIRTFDGTGWRGIIDVVSGGFPCQDISIAGKRIGIEGERSGLWKEMFRVICEVRPRYAFVENSPLLTRRGIDRVLGDLAQMGIMQSGECWELMMSELTILGNEFGFFPTPVASSGSGNRSLGSLKFRPSLTEMARKNMWPTPTSSMQSEVDFVQARYPIKDRPVYSEVNGGPLNPMWVEWLMGWPLGWTDLEPLETAKFQWWLKSHGIS